MQAPPQSVACYKCGKTGELPLIFPMSGMVFRLQASCYIRGAYHRSRLSYGKLGQKRNASARAGHWSSNCPVPPSEWLIKAPAPPAARGAPRPAAARPHAPLPAFPGTYERAAHTPAAQRPGAAQGRTPGAPGTAQRPQGQGCFKCGKSGRAGCSGEATLGPRRVRNASYSAEGEWRCLLTRQARSVQRAVSEAHTDTIMAWCSSLHSLHKQQQACAMHRPLVTGLHRAAERVGEARVPC